MTSSLSSRLSETSLKAGRALAEFLIKYKDGDFPELYDAIEYATASGGKRIRPFLVLQFCRTFGGCDSAALPFACAVEAVHNYSLIHDDLPCMDDDLMRRGKPSCHAAFGEATALLAGDALLTAAFELAVSDIAVSDGAPDCAAKLEAVRLLSEYAGAAGMVGGQQMDLRGEKERPGYEKLVKMNLLKTGALIRASCLLGCIAAGVPAGDARYAAAERFADRIGLAFQLTDDLLDSGTEDEKTTYLTFLSVTEAREYAQKLTDEAACAIADYDRDGILREFCAFIRDREL